MKYSLTYYIKGIYGDTQFSKIIETDDKKLIYSDNIEQTECKNDAFSFYAECQNSETGETLHTTPVIKGLPIGITEDMCFKMVLLKGLKENQKPQEENKNITVNVEAVNIDSDKIAEVISSKVQKMIKPQKTK